MERISIDEARRNFIDVVNLVADGKQRFLVHEKDRDRAAFIPIEDYALLENLDGDRAVEVKHLKVSDAKSDLGKDFDFVADQRHRLVLQRQGVDVAAIVPERDLNVLENLDTRLNLEAAKRLLDREIDGE